MGSLGRKFLPAVLLLLLCPAVSFAETLVPSSLDPAQAAKREAAFIPWSNPEESSAYWKKLSPKNVPIYYEQKPGKMSRDIYIPNPGIGYWVLGGLTREALFRTHRQKLKIGDTLISASVFKDERGNEVYWALWAPRARAYLLTEPMRELGIGQARIEYSAWDKFLQWGESMNAHAGIIALGSLLLNLVLVLVVVILLAVLGVMVVVDRPKKAP